MISLPASALVVISKGLEPIRHRLVRHVLGDPEQSPRRAHIFLAHHEAFQRHLLRYRCKYDRPASRSQHCEIRKTEGALAVVGALGYLPAGIFIGAPPTRD